MSAATELANAEADAVEAELGPDEELEPDGEQEAEPEPEPEPESEASIQAKLKRISDQVDREDNRHEKRYAEILGDDFGMYAPCPLCQLAGYAFTYPPGTMPDEQRAAVALVLGETAGTEYQQAPWAETCLTCAGNGVVLSGAATEHGRLIPCRDCNGSGWREKLAPPPTPIFQAVAQPPAPQPFVGPDPSLPGDKWGRQQGHPHYGIDPNLVYPTAGV